MHFGRQSNRYFRYLVHRYSPASPVYSSTLLVQTDRPFPTETSFSPFVSRVFVTRVFFDAARSSAASPSVSSLFFHSGPHSFVSSSRDSSPNDISLFFATTRARASIDNFLRTTYYTRESKKRKKRHTHNHTKKEKQRKKGRKKRERRDQKALSKKKRRLETTRERRKNF